MTKQDAIKAWAALQAGQDPLPYMRPIAYKTTGSRYGTCGVRIDGSPAFVDAVLSNLKSLIDGENHITRLELARTKIEPVEINGERKTFENSVNGAEVCYIRLHERGGQGSAASAFFDRQLDGATERFAAAHGVK